MKITSVLFMDAVEPSIEFWTKKLGFQVTVSVPEGDKLGFAILQRGEAEVMVQTHASALKDVGELARQLINTKSSLFIEVDDFDDVLKRIEGLSVSMPVRTTFYGMKEIGIVEPGGHFVCFAAHVKK
jgi:uncharacterized glyoxalase superfamily protein PhnB